MVKSRFYPKMVKSFCPNQACCNAHHDIEKGPYRGEYPVRRIKIRFVQARVPVVDRTLRGKTGNESNDDTYTNGNSDIGQFSFQEYGCFPPKIVKYSDRNIA